jgi:hypothetical protein
MFEMRRTHFPISSTNPIVKMETIQQVHDTPLKEDATNTLELIKKIRADHQLLPIMRAKRPLPVTIDDEKLER